MNRNQNIDKLKSEQFDICIIGAGATGAGIALDAAKRGLKVCLIEKNDFASQTSSKSTKLIHGGVRYLEQAVKKLDWAQFQMVSKALKERTTLLKIAPHLTRPLALITPCKNWFEAVYYGIGMKIYDFIAGSHTISASKVLSKKATIALIPELNVKHLSQSVLYYDGQLDDARFCLALVQTAENKGAIVTNHLEVRRFGKRENSGRLKTAEVFDHINNESFSIQAKIFINATGPFADHIRLMANNKLQTRMRVSKGAHIVISNEYMKGNTAVLIPKTDDGRVIFMIPWQNNVLVGTTDTEDVLNENTVADEADTNYLIDYANRYLQKEVTIDEVKTTFAGQRPLLQASFSTDTKSLVRDHEVEVDRRTKLVSIMGGKWTTYRLMAKDTLDHIYTEIWEKKPSHCQTDQQILHGGENYSFDIWPNLVNQYNISEDIAKHLLKKYGVFAKEILDQTIEKKELSERFSPNQPFIKAEIPFVINHEMAMNSEDVLRRLGVNFIDSKAAEIIRLHAEQYF
ncbi:MAG: FAD-dependent oxidoreductase [Bacteroidota bacterium]